MKIVIIKMFFTLVFASVFFHAAAQSSKATTVVFSDDFSNGLEKWEPTRDDGTYWKIENEQLVVTIPRTATISELVPKDTHWDESWENIRYSFEFTPVSGADKNISFHFENLYNWYELHFTNSGLEILRLKNNTVPWVTRHPFVLTNGTTYQISIELNEAQITLKINGEFVLSETDPTFNQNYGKIGIKAGTGSVAPTKIIIDTIEVALLEDTETPLGVALLTQTDERWATQEYDTATTWSTTPTIGRWGCALTSMVMLMHYHGITVFPDGAPITPSTLNSWLKTQNDGYLGEGLVNWLAITRLTREISTTHATPKLEFASVQTELLNTAANQIASNQPVIAAIPGHFVVADGVRYENEIPTDLTIKDPSYSYTLLSQHQTELLSLRTFTPSFTDLSYFLLAPKTDQTITITTDAQQTLPLLTRKESLAGFDSSEQTKTASFFEYAKPLSGTYQVSIAGNPGENFEATLYTYDSTGSVTPHNLRGTLGHQPETYTLAYTKNGASILTADYSLASLQADLAFKYEQGVITSHFVWYELTRLVELAERQSTIKQALLKEFMQALEDFSTEISPEARRYLENRSQQLQT